MMTGVSLPSVNERRLKIVGNPENRRVRDYQAAAMALGCSEPQCVSWSELLDETDQALEQLRRADAIRIESPGENDHVLHQLIRRGGGSGRLSFGEIGCLSEQYRGLCWALERLASVDVPFQNSPEDIRVMFDKWASHLRFQQEQLPRPRTVLVPQRWEEFGYLCEQFGSSQSGRLFLKPRYASSASGVCAYRWSGDRQQLIAPIELVRTERGVRLFNSLRVRSFTDLSDIHAILQRLVPLEMIAEQWIAKARLAEGSFDLRVVVIAGEARHIVVRQSRSPMTNLHLGNRRGDLDEVRREFGDGLLDQCRRLAERSLACFSQSLYAGVDILIPRVGEPKVCEINAFGDLLPNLRHRGEETYEAILRSAESERDACASS